ncbi:MAG: HlyD family efflux transporter periplasmic adaptor subunit [Pirellulaceae bacterium]
MEEELASHRSISKSVSDSEIRRLTLGVEQAKLELVRATHVHSRALSEVKLKSVAVEVAQLRLTRRRIVAPRNGVVTSIKIHPGQSVEAGQTILEIEDLEQLIIDRLVPSAQVNVAELVGCEVRVDLEQAEGAHAAVCRSGDILRSPCQLQRIGPRACSSQEYPTGRSLALAPWSRSDHARRPRR